MIKTVGVVGLGAMGLSIIKHLASLDEFYLIGYSRRIIPGDEKFKTTRVLEDLRDCDLVIEAVEEDINAKCEIFCKLASIVSQKCILATNTSSLSVNEISSKTDLCGRFVGLHFFNPVNRLYLVEVAFLEDTLSDVENTILDFVDGINKYAVVVTDSPGYVVNRLLIPMINDASYLIDECVACAKEIDKAMKLGAGHPIGPLKLADLIGIDVVIAILEQLDARFVGNYRPSKTLTSMKALGHLGRKSKRGFYEYR